MPNEKTQPIQWTERPTGALVAVNSLWPTCCPPAQNPLDANYDSVMDEPQLSYYLVPPW